PGEVKLADLQRTVRELAACSLLAKHWPGKGTRQDAFLALAGGLLVGGWPEARAEKFVKALAQVTADEEPAKRLASIAQTARKIGVDNEITGWTRLTELLGDSDKNMVRRVREWLGLTPAAQAELMPWQDPEPLGEVPEVLPFPL